MQQQRKPWLRPWMVGALALLVLAGIAWAIKPFRVSGGIQMQPQASWQGSSGVPGLYYKTSSGCMCRAPDNTEINLSAGASGGYSTVADEGSGLTQRNTVNFIGAGVSCVDNAGATRTDCTITGGSGYSTLESNGTPVTQRSTANFSADFVVADDAGNSETDISLADLSATYLTVANAASTYCALAGCTMTGTLGGTNTTINGSTSVIVQAGGVTKLQATTTALIATVVMRPSGAGGSDLGITGTEWGTSYIRRSVSRDEALAWSSATPTQISLGNGEQKTITLSTNVTSWSIASGTGPRQILSLIFVQDGAGNRTLAGNASNIKLNGALTLSTAANARDTVALLWDGTNWIELARSLGN